MRLITFILSIIILSLSIVPCSNEMANLSKTEFGIHDHENHQSGHDHQNEESPEDCTPFCSCMCCGVQIVMPEMSVYEEPNASYSLEYYAHYTFQYDYSFSEGIWHPPTTIS